MKLDEANAIDWAMRNKVVAHGRVFACKTYQAVVDATEGH